MKKLSTGEIKIKINDIPGWEVKGNTIEKTFVFKDFSAAITMVNKTAVEAEKMNHHPDIYIHSWNKVKYILSTHSEGGLTEKDFNLAGRIESVNQKIS